MKLNFKELKRKKKSKTVTSEEALKDMIPFDWSEEVLNGDEKVIIGAELVINDIKK